MFLVEPEDKKLGNYLKSGEFTNDTDTLTTIADGIRVLKVGEHCFPILQKYCQYNVISVVSCLLLLIADMRVIIDRRGNTQSVETHLDKN